jgi:hypothetical protein
MEGSIIYEYVHCDRRLRKYYSGGQIKEDEMGGACSMDGRGTKLV